MVLFFFLKYWQKSYYPISYPMGRVFESLRSPFLSTQKSVQSTLSYHLRKSFNPLEIYEKLYLENHSLFENLDSNLEKETFSRFCVPRNHRINRMEL